MLPAAESWAESEGTVTNSERRVQRVRKALEPPGDARDDLWIIYELARRMGFALAFDSRGNLLSFMRVSLIRRDAPNQPVDAAH